MKIQNLHIQNFKRFTDLNITGIPANTKLVLLIGENGSGKSCIFDAFEWLSRPVKEGTHPGNKEYYKKDQKEAIKIAVELDGERTIEKEDTNYHKGKTYAADFYGRSSLRIVPRIVNTNFSPQIIEEDLDNPKSYIDFDNRFLLDVIKYTQDISKALREPVFSGKSVEFINLNQIFKSYIEPLNNAFRNIFGESNQTVIRLIQYEDATVLTPPKLIFKKGVSEINYDLLSHGEKQVVIIRIIAVAIKPNFLTTSRRKRTIINE